MKSKSTEQRLITGNRVLVFVCLALFSIGATAQVLHFHPDPLAGTAKHCPVCTVLHSATPLTHSVQWDISFQTTAYLPDSTDSYHSGTESSFALFSRPPPFVV